VNLWETCLKLFIDEHPNIKAIYPIQMNPVVREAGNEIMGNYDRIRIIELLEVLYFHNFPWESYLMLTDSGGIQEEAPSLGKPALVLRDTTERPKGLETGILKLVGTNEEFIYQTFKLLLENQVEYEKISKASNPYGDSYASMRIADVLEEQ
jgi:UDP-N-acetylglucosamine 2-epimerase (non-hydrolysing)